MSSDRSMQSSGDSDAHNADSDADAEAVDDAGAEAPQPGLFAAPGFLRLWIAQVVSSFGDWIGLLAILVVANRVGGDQPGGAITLVITARILPGFFLASAGGIIVDRFNRKRLLVICDIARASVLLTIPFIDRVWMLVLASLVLELATSLWSPAKEAIVPNIVPERHLTAANSLGMVAAYGTFFVGGLAFAGMAKLGAAFGWTDIGQVEMALVVDSATFLVAALLIATLPLAPHITAAHRKRDTGRRIDWRQGFRDLREGWDFIFLSPQVRAVLVGLSTGMIAGGMLIPLSVVFNDEILGAGSAGHSTILVVMGVGAGVGVSLVTLLQSVSSRRRERTGHEPLGRTRQFVTSLFLAGGALGLAATVSISLVAYAAVLVLGVAAGSVYVNGVTLLHENVEEVLRGRIFAAMFTLVRFFVLVGMAMGGFLSDGFNWLFDVAFDNEIRIGDWALALPGVRGALWLGALLMLLAGALAGLSLRSRRGVGRRAPRSAGATEGTS
ncbi:MAG: MFS transporter [Acidimicrobiales bacterium]|uniref:MFS transporter n=1 Tax=Candidatus Poriferisodalis multihospitum TaxID=2983191 RepID=UPI00137C827A|nr:MFS transporter [Candidatus Poriferisodalis multihospitum]MCY3585495.1 MFS transporter [Acidimicrobiaceae bacterium]MXX44349.1 MFS transporter [Acidimicrobiales bacterium]MCY3608495.1 MFS transporter [Acidimicrobiaceae bacterium]MDE0321776.1 MFS transporter [Acidimicrobiaceae bacterium]MDE0676491.1 MFS transporter [Acidimicrobiaceae bacterium]